MKHLALFVLIMLGGLAAVWAQTGVGTPGTMIQFNTNGSASGGVAPFGHAQVLPFGNVVDPDAIWASIGQAPVSAPGTDLPYGLRIQKEGSFSVYNLIEESGAQNTVIGFGESVSNDIRFRLISNQFAGTFTDIMTITGDQKVGIGTTNPGIYKLAVESEIPYGGKFTVNDISYPATFALEGNVPTPSSGSGYSASGVRGLIGNYFFGYAVYGNAAVGDKRYAGYFVGDVVYTGSISKISDQRLKKNIRNVTSALEIVSQLRPTHYEYKYDAYPNVNLSQEPEYGFIAQEVEKVLPDLVNPIANPIYDNEDPANFKVEEYIGLDYVQFIPILTAAIQELQQEVATLKSQLADTKEYQGDAIGLNIPGEKAILFQNEPNPFAESTTIRYQLPDQFERATLYIFDMQGKQVKAYEGLNERGEVEILGSSLDAGMYLYSLIVDGQEMDTKRMILTK